MTGPVTTDQEAVMIRSEERLHVAKRTVPIGRAVLRRVVVTEQRTLVVEVRHEEVRLEIVPFDGPAEPEDEHVHRAHLEPPQLVLHEEQVLITTRTVPVERVRLVVTGVTTDQVVTADVRREEVLAEVPDGPTAR